MKNSITTGTPEQLLNAVQHKLSELKQGTLTASHSTEEDVLSASNTNTSTTVGTPKQFINLVEGRIEELRGDVEACDKVTASSEEIYIDSEGIMGTRGDTWTISELLQYWEAEQMNDPVLMEYESFDSWLDDTLSHMTLLDDDEVVYASTDENSEKYMARTWRDMIQLLESDGWEVDSIHREYFDEFITMYKDNKTYTAEVTPYSDGSYEIMGYNIHEVVEACDNITASQEVEEVDLLEAFDTCDYEVIDAGYSDNGSIIVSLNHNVDDTDAAAEHLADCLSKYGVEVEECNTNGSNVFVFTPLNNDTTSITSARDDDPTYDDRFIHTLIGDIESEVSADVEGLTFDSTNTDLTITVVHGEEVTQFTVPYGDLSFDFDTIQEDVEYVAKTIRQSVSSAPEYDEDNSITEQEHDEIANTIWDIIDHASKVLDTEYDLQDIAEYESREVGRKGNKYTCTLWLSHLTHDYTIDVCWTKDNGTLMLDRDVEDYGQEIVDIYLEEYGYQEGSVTSATNTSNIMCKPEVITCETDEDDTPTNFTFKESKSVTDSDGMMTDYTWYECADGTHVFVFGDNDVYGPEDGYFDHECDSEEEAREWFDSYTGCSSEDEDPEDEFGGW